MARLVPLVLLALALWLWLRARKKTAAYMKSWESPGEPRRDGQDPRPPAH